MDNNIFYNKNYLRYQVITQYIYERLRANEISITPIINII